MRARLTVAIGPEDVGRRVTVRRRVQEPGQGETLSDVVGYLRDWRDDGWLQIERRTGEQVWVSQASLVAGRVVAAPAPRRLTGRGLSDPPDQE